MFPRGDVMVSTGKFSIHAAVERDNRRKLDEAGRLLDSLWAYLRVPLTGDEWTEAEGKVNELRAVIDKAKAEHDARPAPCPTCANSGIPGKVIINPRWPGGTDPHIDHCPDCS